MPSPDVVRLPYRGFRGGLSWLAALVFAGAPAGAQVADRVQLRIDVSEAEAVLSMLDQRGRGEPIDTARWARLFGTEPYRRLKEREASLDRAFTDDSFRVFVLSDSLAARAGLLRRALDDWMQRDLVAAARGVLDYLPAGAVIHATVYPVIKPRTNSFVFDVEKDPAIFLFLDSSVSPDKFLNTVAHELHHIGFSSVPRTSSPLDSGLSPGARRALDWLGAFGEGFAMLAAAGGPDVHPHAASDSAERARWDRDMLTVDDDLGRVEAFLLEVIEGRLAGEEEERQRGFTFFGVQGPWYTVGYRMAVVIERRFGRAVLIQAMRDPRELLTRYNAAVRASNAGHGESHRMWSARLFAAIGMR